MGSAPRRVVSPIEVTDRGELGARVAELLDGSRAAHAAGQYAESHRRARDVIELLEGASATDEHVGMSASPYVAACALGAVSLSEQGDPGGALALIRKGRAVADRVDDIAGPLMLAIAEGDTLATSGRPAEAIPILEMAARTAREHGRVAGPANTQRPETDRAGAERAGAERPESLTAVLSEAIAVLARAYVGAGRPADAIARAEESLALLAAMDVTASRAPDEPRDRPGGPGVPASRSRLHTVLAQAALALGDVDRAGVEAERAIELATAADERGVEGWARLVAADIAHRRGDRAAAEAHLDDAQDISDELGMMPLIERCRALSRTLR